MQNRVGTNRKPWRVTRLLCGVGASVLGLVALPAQAAQPGQYLQPSIGLGLSQASDQSDANGTGLWLAAEYVRQATSWFSPRAYGGLLITGTDRDSCPPGCDVFAKIAFVGGKARLSIPVPYFSPYFELGLGLSLGTMRTRTPYTNESANVTYHVPIGAGVTLGRHQDFDLGLSFLIHPAIEQVDGAIAIGLRIPL
jgi:hypothetical protein